MYVSHFFNVCLFFTPLLPWSGFQTQAWQDMVLNPMGALVLLVLLLRLRLPQRAAFYQDWKGKDSKATRTWSS